MTAAVEARDKLPEGFVFAEAVDFQAGHNIYIRNLRATVVDTDYPLIYYVFEGQEEVKHRSFAATPYQFSVSQADRELHATEAAEDDDEDNDSDSTSAHPGDSDDGNSSDEDSSDRYRNAANAANNAANTQSGEEKTTADASTGDDDDSGVKTMPPLKEAADAVLSHIKSRPPNHEFRNIVSGEHSTDVSFPQAVRFAECKEAIFEVKNKVAQVELDKCTDITVKLTSVISSVEISNCNDCRIECSAKCNSFVIEKSIGCEIQLVDEGDDVIIVSTKTDDTTVQITAGPNTPASSPSTSSASDSSADDEKTETSSKELKSEAISSFPVTYIIKEDTSDLPAPTPSEPGFEYVNDIPQFITKYHAVARKISTSLMKRDARGAIENLNN